MSLRAKAVLTILPLALACGIAAVMLSHRTVYSTLVEEAARAVMTLMEEAQSSLRAGVSARSEKMLLPRVQSLARSVDALDVFVCDTDGIAIVHSNVAKTGRKAAGAFVMDALAAGQGRTRLNDRGGVPFLDLSLPVWDDVPGEASGEDFLLSAGNGAKKRAGTLFLRVPIERYLRLDRRISGRLLWVITGIVFATFLAIFILLELALRPVKQLTAATERVRGGEYGVTVPSLSSDEIGRLADSFNRMSLGLKETTVSRDYFDNLLRNILDTIIVTDENAVVTMINPACERLLGYGQGELSGRKACELFTAGCREKNGWIGRAVKGETVEGREAVMLARDGAEIPVLLSVAGLSGKGGRAGLVAVARDIRERKKIEAALRQSEKMSAVGVLAAGVAHEINNPLGIMLGFAQAVAKKLREDDPLSMPIRSIEREAVRCKDLVQSLLVFSRASRSEQWEELGLNAAVDGALALIVAQAKAHGVELKVEMGRGLPAIYANRSQVQQVAINLAANGIDAMNGGGTLAISTAAPAGRPGYVELRVTDTGSGIPAEIQEQIFEPFFTTKEVGKGTGLGLALVYEIVQKHGGIIEFNSEPGKGTEFLVLFPAGRPRGGG